jgi:diguanylate cyclase (GGDEF)-like protein/PAS domain S-box-containing protein
MNFKLTTYNETQRLEALRRLNLIDTPREPEFDELVELAAAICEVPISLMTLVDDRRQWFKAALGITVTEMPLELTFCQYTIRQDDPLIVEDTTKDAFFCTHPSVVNDPSVRFYAGISIKTSTGYPVGTLCVADMVPRRMSATQIKTLTVLARQANARIELREQRLSLERALSEAEQAKERLAASEARFKTFMDSAPFMSYLKDADGRFLFCSRSIAERYRISQEDWIGKTALDLLPAEVAEPLHRHDMEVLSTQEMNITDEAVTPPDGDPVHLRMYRFPCTDGDKFLLGVISVDMTEDLKLQAELHRSQQDLEEANVKLQALARTDALTGLANRRAFDERLAMEFAQARRKHRALSVIMIDIDNFKQLNDRRGHEAGDLCLKQIATLLAGIVRENDLVARYGGEEFVVLLPDTAEAQAMQLAERILSAMHIEPWNSDPMTLSGGVADITPTTAGPQQLLIAADDGLYAAKRAGKDRIVSSREHREGLNLFGSAHLMSPITSAS